MKRARVHLIDVEKEAVEYEGPRKAKRYFRRLMKNEYVDTYSFELILDFATHRTHLTRYCLDITQGKAELPDPLADRERLVQYVLRCYIIAHRRAAALNDILVEKAARGMWALTMHIYGWAQWGTRIIGNLLELRASAFPFCETAGEDDQDLICVSQEPISDYSVHTHWQAFTTLVPALYNFPYSTGMYDYVRALTVRHSQILEGLADPLLYDDPLYCTLDIKGSRVFYQHPEDADALLNDLYVGQGETLIGPQMIRMGRVRWLMTLAMLHKAKIDTAPTPVHVAQGILKFVAHLAKHDVLRTFIVDPMKERLLDTNLMHGERVRFVRKNPNQEPQADSILGALRQADFNKMSPIMNTPLGVMAETLAAACGPEAEKKDYAARPRLPYEREMGLGLHILLDVWMTYRGAESGLIAKSIYMEEMHIGKEEMADPYELPPKRPALVRCMRWHFVMDAKDQVVYAGTSLFMGYLKWLELISKATIPGTSQKSNIIHEDLAVLLTPEKRTKSSPTSAAKPVAESPVEYIT